jgi:hypothetical protein
MYWNLPPLVPSIPAAMSLKRFDAINRYLHFNDKTQMVPADSQANIDKLFKVRPLLQVVKQQCNNLEQEEFHSIDEQIIPTKGRSNIRQYVPKKPHKWGIKVYIRCGISGILYHFHIYTGKNNNSKSTLGATGATVLSLCETLPKQTYYKIFFDNFFTSFPLLKKMKEDGFLCVGTMRANRLKGADKHLKSKRELSTIGRGSWDCVVDSESGISITRWLDNSIVHLATTYVPNESSGRVTRYSAETKQFISIDCPKVVSMYNKHMGGVDLLDMLLALYRINKRSKKNYHYIFYFLLNVACVNGWLLYRRYSDLLGEERKNQLTLLQFQKQVAEGLLNSGKYGISRKRGRPSRDASLSTSSSSVKIPVLREVSISKTFLIFPITTFGISFSTF